MGDNTYCMIPCIQTSKWVKRELCVLFGGAYLEVGSHYLSREGRVWDPGAARGDLWVHDSHSFVYLGGHYICICFNII